MYVLYASKFALLRLPMPFLALFALFGEFHEALFQQTKLPSAGSYPVTSNPPVDYAAFSSL
jgi:hypothetical protein